MHLVLYGDATFATVLASRPQWTVLHEEPLNFGTQLKELRRILKLSDVDGGMQGIQLFRFVRTEDPKGDLLAPNMSPQDLGIDNGFGVYVVSTSPLTVPILPLAAVQQGSPTADGPHLSDDDLPGPGLKPHNRQESVMGRLRTAISMSPRQARAATRMSSPLSPNASFTKPNDDLTRSPSQIVRRVPFIGEVVFGESAPTIKVAKDKRSAYKAGSEAWDSLVVTSTPICGGTVRFNVRSESRTDCLPSIMLGVIEMSEPMNLTGPKSYSKGWFFSVVDGAAYSVRAPGPVMSRREYFYVKNGVVSLVLDMDEGKMRIEHNGVDLGIAFTCITCPSVYFAAEIYSNGAKVEIAAA